MSKGRGRVVARRSGEKAVLPFRLDRRRMTAAAALTQLSQREREEGERETDLPRRFPAWLIEEWIPRRDVQMYVRHATPAILTRIHLIDPTALTELLEADEELHEVWMAPIGKSRFYDADAEKNVYGTGYHIREPETLKQRMALSAFKHALETWQQWSLHLTVQPVILAASETLTELSKVSIPISGCSAGSSGDLGRSWFGRVVEVEWLSRFMKLQRWTHISGAALHMASINALFPAQYQPRDRLVCMVSGRVRVLLISPRYAFEGVYPFPVHHPYDTYSMVDFDRVDGHPWPAFSKVRGSCCVLEPGEMLYIPEYWFVHLQVLERGTQWVNFDVTSQQRLRAPEAIPLEVSRSIEDYAVTIQDIPHSRQWLLKIAQNRELLELDLGISTAHLASLLIWVLGSVTGYLRLELVERIREEIELSLQTDAQQYLEKLCDGRLVPTPWLNKVSPTAWTSPSQSRL